MHVWTCKRAEKQFGMSALCPVRLLACQGYHFRLPVPATAPSFCGDVQVLLAATLTVVQGAVLVGSATGAYSQASAGALF